MLIIRYATTVYPQLIIKELLKHKARIFTSLRVQKQRKGRNNSLAACGLTSPVSSEIWFDPEPRY